MAQHQVIPFLIITITMFLLVEQNNFTQVKEVSNDHHQCVWPPQPIVKYFSPDYWTKLARHPVCNKEESSQLKELLQNQDQINAITGPESGESESKLLFGVDHQIQPPDSVTLQPRPEEVFLPTEPPPTTEKIQESVVSDESNRSTESPISEDTIPSFSEWTKLQLAQRKESIINDINKNKTLQHQDGKNFASPVCGAKIRNNNPEAQNPSGIISSSHDEYMLNRCTSTIWFILELCEPVQIDKVAFGNLELFASNPHEIDLEISVRYPTREWSLLGTFHAPDVRNVHSLILPASSNSTFGKFLRVSIKSYHGNEHYCPLSLIKVFGKSEYEVLESEPSSGADDQSNSDNEGSSMYEEELSFNNRPVTKSVLGAAKDAVIDMVKKAVNVLGSNGHQSTTTETANTEALLTYTTLSTCMSLVQCIEESNTSFRDDVLATLSCKPHILLWMEKHVHWCGWDSCHTLLRSYSIGSPWMPEGFFIALYGPSIIESLCQFINPMKSCKRVPTIINGTRTSFGEDALLQLENGVPNGTLQPLSSHHIEQNEKNNSMTNGEEVVTVPTIIETQITPPSVIPVSEGTSSPNFPAPPHVCSTEQPPQQQTDQLEHFQQTQQQPEETSVPDPPLPSPPPVIIVEHPVTTGSPPPQSLPSPPITVIDDQYFSTNSQQNKESVFVRLSNRIKALEMNQSLSSGYLEELSRRFKKQNEDINHSHEHFRNMLNESMRRSKWLENSFRYEIRKLSRNIENLREVIYKVEVQRSGLVIFGMLQLVCTVFVFWKHGTHSCCKCNSAATNTNTDLVREPTRTSADTRFRRSSGSGSVDLSVNHHNPDLMFRKRSNSDQLKKVSKKKKRKELALNRAGNNDVFSFKTPVILNSASSSSLPLDAVKSCTSASTDNTAHQNSSKQNQGASLGNGSKNSNGNGNGKINPGGKKFSPAVESQTASKTNGGDKVSEQGSSSKNSSGSSNSLNSTKSNTKTKLKSFLFFK